MRDRRWRRLVDADGDRQHTTVKAAGGGVRNRFCRPIVASFSVISVALGVVGTGWVTGFFDFILRDVAPSGVDTACALRETIKYHWFATPRATSERFTILIATIDHDDADHTYTRAVERAFLKKNGIDRSETCRVLRLGVGRDAEITVETTAREWLEHRHADLLIGGELLKKEDAVSLWFIDKDPAHEWPSTHRLDANLLKSDFPEAASTWLLSIALSAVRPAKVENGRYLVGILNPVVERLRHLLQAPTGFTARQRAGLEDALGIALSVIGEQAGNNNALADGIKAFRAALEERTRDLMPLEWARTQNNLGAALLRLGERESRTPRLEEAVAAFHASLCCTDQHPGAVRPPQRHLREANVLRPPKLEHPV